jgi:REP element-mobilizing transposase RayT
MSPPRRVLPDATYLVTRRCAQREFLLKPSRATIDLLRFLIAVAAQRHGILIHAFCVLSNHVHLLLTDPDARLPKFEQFLNSLVARAMNAVLGRSESFWAAATTYSAVTLLSPTDVLEKAVYVLANPVQAGLVRTGREWPGAWSSPEALGTVETVARPAFFFRKKKSKLPETAELALTAPPGFPSVEAFRDALVAQLTSRERTIAAEMEASGREFLGARRVLAQKPTARPATEAPIGGLKPSVAGRDKWRRIEALSRLVAFRRAYREAWAKMRKGATDVIFPAGTYWLRVTHGVRCEAAA